MDARCPRFALLLLTVLSSTGAVYRTPNFEVTAPSQKIARLVGDHAERYRVELAEMWLGHRLPRWAERCPIQVKVGQIGAGGATSFAFDRGEVFGWNMTIQGTLERILDSVLPHEVSHTIFACHFRRPLPRWADEGAATLVEHESERRRQTLLLNDVLRSGRRIPLRQLLSMKEYPKDAQRVFTLYAQGYSLADFLIEQGGRAKYLDFLNAAHKSGWDAAIREFYEHDSVELLEKRWSGWFMAGSPRLGYDKNTLLADGETQDAPQATEPTIRAQNADQEQEEASRDRRELLQPVSLIEAPDPRKVASLRSQPKKSAPQPPQRKRSRQALSKPVSQVFADQDGWAVQDPQQVRGSLARVDSSTRGRAPQNPSRRYAQRNFQPGVIDPGFDVEERNVAHPEDWTGFPHDVRTN